MGGEKKKILVVEDSLELRSFYKLILGKDYEVEEAANGREAVSSYRDHRLDLVLMDIHMPVMNGDAAIREIRRLDPESRILALTGYDYTEEELGVPVVDKPFNIKELKQTIADMIDQRHS